MNPLHVWVASVAIMCAAFCGLFWVLYLYSKLNELWKMQSARISELESEDRALQRRAASAETRLDALEKRPPITNVTVQMLPQTPALKPKAGTK